MARERTGSIVTRKTARAKVRFIDVNGKKVSKSLPAVDLDDAKAKLKELRSEIGSSGGTILTSSSRGNTLYARLRYRDRFGTLQTIEEKATDRSDAKRRLKQMLLTLEAEGPEAVQANKDTFGDLADLFKELRLIPAEYSFDRDGNELIKRRGLRSLAGPLRWWNTLKDHFGSIKLSHLTFADLENFKRKREKALTKSERPLAIASINREMELLRSMLNFAVQNSMLKTSPFKKGPSLISKASETRRERTLTYDEEIRFINSCSAFQRKYKRNDKEIEAAYEGRRTLMNVAFIMALDTAMRKGEILSLRWKNINFEEGTISITSFNSKTSRPRTVPLTQRLCSVLQELRVRTSTHDNDPVFQIKNGAGSSFADNFGRTFRTTCNDANIADLAFHDLRHTATTRMIRAGIPHAEVMKVTGHSQMTTFLRYLNPDSQRIGAIGGLLDTFNANQLLNEGNK